VTGDERLGARLKEKLGELSKTGRAKGTETVIAGVLPPFGGRGTRYLLQGCGDTEFIRMNSNSYLGFHLRDELIRAEESASREFGVGPGAVRFISGTTIHHKNLEKRLAEFHMKEACMIFSSAYSAVLGVIPPLVDEHTAVLTDELNHNSIINAVRLSRPGTKEIYSHNNTCELEKKLKSLRGKYERIIMVTDGIFSMRGDHAPLDKICGIKENFSGKFPEGITLVLDDSHGIGAFGETGRGTGEFTGAGCVDILVSTLGKALGVNGGYAVSSDTIIKYLRETAPFYIYSNPITAGEAAASLAAVDLLDSRTGIELLGALKKLTARLEEGLKNAGYDIIESSHPIVPVLVRDPGKCKKFVDHLMRNRILATGITYPVVPRGEDEIRLQVNADHTEDDIDFVVEVFGGYEESGADCRKTP
jgi:glycine C-acetyltransferase